MPPAAHETLEVLNSMVDGPFGVGSAAVEFGTMGDCVMGLHFGGENRRENGAHATRAFPHMPEAIEIACCRGGHQRTVRMTVHGHAEASVLAGSRLERFLVRRPIPVIGKALWSTFRMTVRGHSEASVLAGSRLERFLVR